MTTGDLLARRQLAGGRDRPSQAVPDRAASMAEIVADVAAAWARLAAYIKAGDRVAAARARDLVDLYQTRLNLARNLKNKGA